LNKYLKANKEANSYQFLHFMLLINEFGITWQQ
ncbi:MAG: hypothetical protein ACJAUV_001900, partial [Flavobacteriales bacterium]